MDPVLLLLVEDDPDVRMVLEIELSGGGFDVLLAADGTEALGAITDRTAEIRCLVTDVRLGPAVDGWEVARRARQLIPDIPVVYVTGDSAGEWSAQGVPKSILLSKPFSPSQVTVAVTSLLNEAHGSQSG